MKQLPLISGEKGATSPRDKLYNFAVKLPCLESTPRTSPGPSTVIGRNMSDSLDIEGDSSSRGVGDPVGRVDPHGKP